MTNLTMVTRQRWQKAAQLQTASSLTLAAQSPPHLTTYSRLKSVMPARWPLSDVPSRRWHRSPSSNVNTVVPIQGGGAGPAHHPAQRGDCGSMRGSRSA